MADYFEIVSRVLGIYWGNSAYQWIFFVSLVMIFFIEKDKNKRVVFFWFPILVYVLLASPMWFMLGGKMWGDSGTAYFTRQFSLVPIFYVISYALVLVLNRFSGKKKLLFFVTVCISLIVCGSNLIYIHHTHGFEKSDNINKIPKDLMMICNYMDTVDEDPVLAINTNYSYMVRQYDPSVHLLVGVRADNELANELYSNEPDVKYIMSELCSRGGDFVAVINNDSIQEAFATAGFQPCFKTDGLLLYKSGGYPGARYTYNDIEQLVRIDYYDEKGAPRLLDEGMASIEYVYDEHGRKVEEHYFGTDSKATLTQQGMAGVLYSYADDGRIAEIEYLGVDGKAKVVESLGYASARFVRDERGNVIEEYYFDEKKRPIFLSNGNAGVSREFDEYNRVTKMKYLNDVAEPVVNTEGVASVLYDYSNELGLLESYYDKNGQPAENTDGYYGKITKNNEAGNLSYQIYVDKNAQPMESKEGYAKIAYVYDIKNRLIRVSFYDANGNATMNNDGYAGYRCSYNEDGETTYVYFGLDGEVIEEF